MKFSDFFSALVGVGLVPIDYPEIERIVFIQTRKVGYLVMLG
jgi:hypothetical protein